MLYSFFKLLNVAILILTGRVGLTFLIEGMRSMNTLALRDQIAEHAIRVAEEAEQTEPAEVAPLAYQPVSMGLLNVWVILYGFVGTQLAWTLRPFFGNPNAPFQIFRPIESNFYVNIVQTLMHMF